MNFGQEHFLQLFSLPNFRHGDGWQNASSEVEENKTRSASSASGGVVTFFMAARKHAGDMLLFAPAFLPIRSRLRRCFCTASRFITAQARVRFWKQHSMNPSLCVWSRHVRSANADFCLALPKNVWYNAYACLHGQKPPSVLLPVPACLQRFNSPAESPINFHLCYSLLLDMGLGY